MIGRFVLFDLGDETVIGEIIDFACETGYSVFAKVDFGDIIDVVQVQTSDFIVLSSDKEFLQMIKEFVVSNHYQVSVREIQPFG